MRNFFDRLTWGILLFLFLPTVGIIASWNSLPGDPLFSIKLGGEQALLFLVKPSYVAQGTLQIKYTERRLAETKSLLANKHSVQGLTYLEQQVTSTKASIQNAPNTAVRRELAQTYITTLKQVKTELAAQKVAVGSAPVTVPSVSTQPPLGRVPTPTATPTQRLPGAPVVSTPTPTPAPAPAQAPLPPADIGGEIDQTQDQIDQTIDDLEKMSMQTESVQDNRKGNEDTRGNGQRGNGGGDYRGRDNNR